MPGGVDLWRSLDDDGQDDGAGAFDDHADAATEGHDASRGSFDAPFGEDAERPAALQVAKGLARAHALAAGAVDEDDAGPAPEPLAPGVAHVLGHEPADLEGTDGLDEDGIDAGGVVGDDDDGASLRERPEVFAADDTEAVDETGVDLEEAVDDPGFEVAPRVVEEPAAHPSPGEEGKQAEGE